MFRPDVGDTHATRIETGQMELIILEEMALCNRLVDSYQMMDGSDFFDHFTFSAWGIWYVC
jgi:hypothetical protein